MKDPINFRVAKWICWTLWIALVPVFILTRWTGWIVTGLGDVLVKAGTDFNDFFEEIIRKIAKTIKETERFPECPNDGETMTKVSHNCPKCGCGTMSEKGSK